MRDVVRRPRSGCCCLQAATAAPVTEHEHGTAAAAAETLAAPAPAPSDGQELPASLGSEAAVAAAPDGAAVATAHAGAAGVPAEEGAPTPPPPAPPAEGAAAATLAAPEEEEAETPPVAPAPATASPTPTQPAAAAPGDAQLAAASGTALLEELHARFELPDSVRDALETALQGRAARSLTAPGGHQPGLNLRRVARALLRRHQAGRRGGASWLRDHLVALFALSWFLPCPGEEEGDAEWVSVRTAPCVPYYKVALRRDWADGSVEMTLANAGGGWAAGCVFGGHHAPVRDVGHGVQEIGRAHV